MNGDEWDVGVARDRPVPRITAAVRIVKVYAIGIAPGSTLDPTVIVDEVAEIVHETRRVVVNVVIVIDSLLRRPSYVLVPAVGIGHVGIHYEIIMLTPALCESRH